MSADFVIIGGGCYGTYYVEQLAEARSRGKLDWTRALVLDRDRECAVASSSVEGVEVVETEWESWGAEFFAEPEAWSEAQLVPAPIAPHVVRHWLVEQLRRDGIEISDARWTDPIPRIPYADITDGGQLVVSHAPGLCPTNCVEPRMCPLTGGARTWDMQDTVREAADDLAYVATLTCHHFAYGVGTIPFASIAAQWRHLRELEMPARVGIATVSRCHGLVDVVTLRAPPRAPRR